MLKCDGSAVGIILTPSDSTGMEFSIVISTFLGTALQTGNSLQEEPRVWQPILPIAPVIPGPNPDRLWLPRPWVRATGGRRVGNPSPRGSAPVKHTTSSFLIPGIGFWLLCTHCQEGTAVADTSRLVPTGEFVCPRRKGHRAKKCEKGHLEETDDAAPRKKSHPFGSKCWTCLRTTSLFHKSRRGAESRRNQSDSGAFYELN